MDADEPPPYDPQSLVNACVLCFSVHSVPVHCLRMFAAFSSSMVASCVYGLFSVSSWCSGSAMFCISTPLSVWVHLLFLSLLAHASTTCYPAFLLWACMWRNQERKFLDAGFSCAFVWCRWIRLILSDEDQSGRIPPMSHSGIAWVTCCGVLLGLASIIRNGRS